MLTERQRQGHNTDVLHLGCGEEYHDDAWNVDVNPGVDPDEVADLAAVPWPWPDNSVTVIRAYHVLEHLPDIEAALRECARVLAPGGYLDTRWPMGMNARADPDHEHEWTWQTPLFYCGERHWDTDVGLEVVDRYVDLYCHRRPSYLARAIERLWAWQRRRYGPGEWCFGLPCMSGEFTVVFEKP